MTDAVVPEIAPHTMLHTTPVEHPYRVRLEGVSVEDRELVTVYDHVVVGDRAIVRSASGEGFWHVAVHQTAAESIPMASFETHPTVCFSFPQR